MSRVNSIYSQWFGYDVESLRDILLRATDISNNERPHVIWLVGDSSLDNKAWVREDQCLRPHTDTTLYERAIIESNSLLLPDVAYHVNKLLPERWLCLCCAAEEAKLVTRAQHGLSDQEAFARDNFDSEKDVFVVSIGGNDILLGPDAGLAASVGVALLWSGVFGWWLPSLFGWAPGISSLRQYYEEHLKSYLTQLRGDNGSSANMILCAPYYPCEIPQNGWSKRVLHALRYHDHPWIAQQALRSVFDNLVLQDRSLKRLRLFDFLDPHDHALYVAGVEPSDLGGQHIARGIYQYVDFQTSTD